MAVCLFHDDKLQFDIVCKDIVRAKVLPRTCAHRLGMAVCACRRNKIEIEKFLSAEKLRTVISYINEHVLNRADLPTNLSSFIEKILFRNITLGDYSCCKFLSIMYDSLADKKYDQLSREATNSKTMTSATPEVAQANTKRKMNQKQFDIMMKRKLSNKDRTTRFSLPMFAGNVLKLKNNVQYEAMRKRYGNSVFVQFCDKENTEHITNNKTLTEVDVYAKEKTNAEKFITEARTHARAIQEAEEEKRKTLMIQRKQRKAMLRQRHDYVKAMLRQRHDYVKEPGLGEEAMQYKENLEKEHCIKSSKKSNDNQWKKSTPSPLDGGRCLRCLAPFQSLKVTDKENNHCTHHPGFIRYDVPDPQLTDRKSNFMWTCCRRESADGQPSHSSHSDTGCEVGVHCWRQNKKQLQKVSDKTDLLEKNRTRTLVKHGQCNSARDVISKYNAQFLGY